MKSIGETLRRERLRRNLDLEKISQELKISVRMLEAIEAEQFDRLPGGVFAKSFVRQYARLLGLDEDEMAEVERILRPELEPAPPPETPPHDGPLIPLPRVEEWQSVADRRSWSSFLPSAVLVVVAMLVCSGVYAFWQRAHRPVSAQSVEAPTKPAPAAQAPSQPSPAPAATSHPAAAAIPPPAKPPAEGAAKSPAAVQADVKPAAASNPASQSPPAAQPAATPAAVTPVAAKPGPVHVELTATEPAWVLVRADGKYVFSGVLEGKQSRTVDANDTVLLWLGNAGGVEVSLNGKRLGPLGPKGQVQTLQLTSGGFQMVAAPKPPVPLDPL
jgi:cytoskeleton protein RodZ